MAEPKRAKGTLTIYDVAKRAGVSIASVSRVLNDQGSPRAETRERVIRAVREMDFVPDGAARALSNGLKEVVGVVFRRGVETLFEDARLHVDLELDVDLPIEKPGDAPEVLHRHRDPGRASGRDPDGIHRVRVLRYAARRLRRRLSAAS